MADYQVGVIGAGIIGAAIADSLAVRGASVTLYDMRSPGAGASQASAGVLAPYVEAKPGSPLLALGTRSLAMWDSWVGALRARAAVPFDYARSGTLEVTLTTAEHERLQRSAAWLVEEGIPHQWLDDAAMRVAEPHVSHAAIAGLLISSHGWVQVPNLMTALMWSARLHGATCETPREIVHVEQQRGSVQLRVGDAVREFDHVVIAAGSWSRRVRVAGVPVFPVRPIRGQLLHLTWPEKTVPTRSVWGSRCYTVPWTDGSLLVGATVEDVGFDENSTVEGVNELLSAVTELLPAAARATVDEVRVGLRPSTADHLPLIGTLESHPRVTIATGHYRNGILLAPLTADMVTRLILDGERDPLLALTEPERFLTVRS